MEGPLPPRRIRAEVLNGCGETGVARKFADIVRSRGFDVVKEGNAERFEFFESMVIDRAGSISQAETVARALGIENWIQQVKVDSFRIEDVSIIVGWDLVRKGALLDHNTP